MTYTAPTFVDVPNPASPPAGAQALSAANMNALAQAVQANSGLTFNVKDPSYGAKGDGATDDAAAINAAINAASGAGGTVFLPAGVYLCGSTITLPTGVHLRGSGIGGDIYSNTDNTLPFRGTVLKLKSGANVDLVKTANFATLTGQSSPTSAATPGRFGLHDLVLDGNKQGNTTGLPLRIFGRAYEIDHVIIQNGATGGAYSEYGSGGYEMEARWANFTITDCAGDGLAWKGPHDSQFVNGLVARNDGHVGINLGLGGNVGGEMFTNIHAWGNHTYQWVIGSPNSAYLNCVSDGPGGVQFLAQGCQWLGGAIYGSNVVGQAAITIGDGTNRLIQANNITTRLFNYAKGSAAVRLLSDTNTQGQNWFRLFVSMGGNSRYTMGAGMSTLSAGATLPATTLAVANASSFPTGGGSLYVSDGTNIETGASYTGVSGNTLTGVTGGSGTYASGAAVFSMPSTAGQNTIELYDTDTATGGVIQYLQGGATQFWLAPTSFNVGGQTLRPNNNSVAYQQIRNETGRTDYVWDNTGTAGTYSYRNGATVEGRSDDTTRTWKLNSALGTVQTGSGATASRPSASTAGAGAQWYDTTLGKPIWSNGSVWRDATGTAV